MILKKTNPDTYTFFQHWDELRARLLWSTLAVLAATFLAYTFSDELMSILIRPIGSVVFKSPPDAFIARVNLSLVAGIIMALPIVLLQIWGFVAGGLKPTERKAVTVFAPLSILMFLAGVSFAYFAVIPVTIRFLMGFSSPQLVPMITVDSYISFVGSTLFAFGVIFETPLILLFLTKIGIATPEFLIQKRRYAIMIILFVSAIITPPDCITLLMMSVPLLLLYEAGILISKYASRSSGLAHDHA